MELKITARLAGEGIDGVKQINIPFDPGELDEIFEHYGNWLHVLDDLIESFPEQVGYALDMHKKH